MNTVGRTEPPRCFICGDTLDNVNDVYCFFCKDEGKRREYEGMMETPAKYFVPLAAAVLSKAKDDYIENMLTLYEDPHDKDARNTVEWLESWIRGELVREYLAVDENGKPILWSDGTQRKIACDNLEFQYLTMGNVQPEDAIKSFREQAKERHEAREARKVKNLATSMMRDLKKDLKEQKRIASEQQKEIKLLKALFVRMNRKLQEMENDGNDTIKDESSER